MQKERYEKVIRDNVHSDIYFNEPIFMELINTPEFQRLRRISQLAGVSSAYPSAVHSRFSHSIGTYHILTLFFEAYDFKHSLTEEERRLTLIAGLLHDIGHGPFSHSFEKLNPIPHEDYSAAIIKNPEGNIAKTLNKYHINPEAVASIIEGKHPSKILNLLVSSQLDADRLDYLMRDSYNAGVDYALLDIRWIIRHAKIMDDKIVFPSKVKYAIQSYLLGRHHMYQQVYNHPSSIAFDALLQKWFERLVDLVKDDYLFHQPMIPQYFRSRLKNGNLDLEDYLKLDDSLMESFFHFGVHESDPIFSDLSNRLLNRGLFKAVAYSETTKSEISRLLTQKGYDLRYYLVEHTPKQATIYQDDFLNQKDETIWFDEGGEIKPLSHLKMITDSRPDMAGNNNGKKLLFPKELV